VSSGLALNRKGQILALPDDQQLMLTRKVGLAAPEAGLFLDCSAATSTTTNLKDGIYALVVGPTSGYKDRAPLKALNAGDMAAGCGARYAVEGVKFRLAELDLASLSQLSQTRTAQIQALVTQGDTLSLAKLRNIVAHLCFGTENWRATGDDLFADALNLTPPRALGILEVFYRNGTLTGCEIPLALVHWASGQVRFI